MVFEGKKYDTSSRLNRTPPIGAPNATATPAADAALNSSRLFPSLKLYLLNNRHVIFPIQHY